MLAEQLPKERVVLIGLESSGKSTLFTKLIGNRIGEETNVKGTTYSIKFDQINQRTIVDTPGLTFNSSVTDHMAISEIRKSTSMILVVRGTHFQEELSQLLPLIENTEKTAIIAVTHADKMLVESKLQLKRFMLANKIPLFIVNTRVLKEEERVLLLQTLEGEHVINEEKSKLLLNLKIDKNDPAKICFDIPILGPLLSVLSLLLMFLLPVLAAYLLSEQIQPLFDNLIINMLISLTSGTPSFIESVLIGNYGLLTLGIYSFIWAFPVVVFIGLSTSIADETGLKDRIIDSLDPLLKKIGLSGQDLLPVLTGFGCNVVAIYQSRNCQLCTRKQCVSLITFGSACSYQIGATLSIFNSAGKPWLFFPYLLMLIVGGILHTRLWYKKQAARQTNILPVRKTFLQMPTVKGTFIRYARDIKQFLTQAMPIFLLICIVSTILYELKLIDFLQLLFVPLLTLLGLPYEAGAGLAFSFIRKDGILIFNENGADFITQLTDLNLLLLIFLASTLTACAVTILTMWKEFGGKLTSQFVGKQIITSVTLACLVTLIFRFF
ncbi:nucleoside recognition domain-containing protein [Metabacillus herbersteinensis]|uniref:Nucleoside recognition domain-containing protein n=1 Tax=Metabacillus herbersteinensis TaxID=283816 RepID=A0ABV6GKB3_9BACI